MGQYKTEAILLTVRDWDAVDRMVTLFSREYGKISAIAYGARRPRSQMAGTVQPFIHAELLLTPGKRLESIRQCEVLNSFRELRQDLEKMAYASFIGELAAELWPEREADPAVFDMLMSAFRLLSSRNPRITALACAFQLLALGGFKPEYANCVVCGQPISFPARFSASVGGALCAVCDSPAALEYTTEMNNFIDLLLSLDWQNPGHFSVTGAVLLKTEQLLADFITCRLDKKLKSLAFIAIVT